MKSQTFILQNPGGFHARPAALFAQLCAKFNCAVQVSCKGKQANGKSVLNLMTLGAGKGEEVQVVANGGDEDAAMKAIDIFLRELSE